MLVPSVIATKLCRLVFLYYVGVHHRIVLVLHGLKSLGNSSGSTTKASGCEI